VSFVIEVGARKAVPNAFCAAALLAAATLASLAQTAGDPIDAVASRLPGNPPTIFTWPGRCDSRRRCATRARRWRSRNSSPFEAAAGVRQPLLKFAKTRPDMRVRDGHFQVIPETISTPRGREVGARCLRGFVEEMKSTGFVTKALARGNQPDATAAGGELTRSPWRHRRPRTLCPGGVPATHALLTAWLKQDVGARHKAGRDDREIGSRHKIVR
jgi:hypothetical protein